MKPQERAVARRKLDKRLMQLHNADYARPPSGWVKAIREALGMTTAQLARRIGVSQPRVVEIERNEKTGAITLDSLERAARALDCELVYALVPRQSLEEMVNNRAMKRARNQLAHASHSMALEDQAVTSDDAQEQLRQLARQILDKPGSGLWNDQ